MPLPKFAVQPHYRVETPSVITDTRVTSALQGIEQLHQDPEAAAASALPWYKRPLVHTVRLQKTLGARDGDDYSGAVELYEIRRGEGVVSAAIRGTCGNNTTGIPSMDGSWHAYFDRASDATGFCKQWKASFRQRDVFEGLRRYIAEHRDEIVPGSISLRGIGLLLPWYLQRQGSVPLLDEYGTDGTDLVMNPGNLETDPAYKVGQVYRVPEFNVFSTKVQSWAARTCLATFVVRPEQTPRQWAATGESTPLTFVQWDDGALGCMQPGPEYAVPLPLRRRDLIASNT